MIPDRSIFWIHAGNAAKFEEGYKRIAVECNIPGRDDPTLDLMQLVRDWMESKHGYSWLMIVDNIDNGDLLYQTNSAGKNLLGYVPQSSKGSILYTTRNRDVGVDLAEDPIYVPAMKPTEAEQLLTEKLGRKVETDESAALFKELEYLPLAIVQAAAYMVKRRLSVGQYLDLYRHNDSSKV
jgi:hypothetical protein